MTVTTHYDLQKPVVGKNVNEEFLQLGDTLDQLDAILNTQNQAIGGKAPVVHVHAIGDISGLIDALNAKMSASMTFKLDSLTDVDGADAAPVGYVLQKTASGWLPVSAATAMGNHNHTTAQVNGLDTALAGKLNTSQLDTDAALTANSDTKISSQKAVKSYVDGLINTIRGGVSSAFDTLSELAANFANYVPTNANRVRATELIGSNPGFEFIDTFGKRRGLAFWNSSTGELILVNYDTDGVTQLNTLKIPGTAGGELTLGGYKVATEANIGNIYGGNVIQGGVGAVQMLAHGTANTALVYGTNYAGSSLRLCSLHGDGTGVFPGISGTAPSGTWKCLGTISANASRQSISLFLRIA